MGAKMRTFFKKNYKLPLCKFRGSKHNIKFPCYVSLKLDGELQYIIKRKDTVFSVNKDKYGRYRLDYPALYEFKKLNLPDGIYLAELYYGAGRTKEDFYQLLRNKASNDLNLALFGILQKLDRTNFDARQTFNYFSHYSKLTEHFEHLRIVPMWMVMDWKELRQLIKKWIYELGYEGLVVRNENSVWTDGQHINWIKIKRKDREIAQKNKNGNKVNFTFNYGIWL